MTLDKLALAALAVLFWGVFILFFLFNTMRCAHEWSILSWLARSGINVDGQIVSLKTRTGGKSGRTIVVYQFHPNTERTFGSKITAEQQISLRHSNKLIYGASVIVKFLSFAPTISRL